MKNLRLILGPALVAQAILAALAPSAHALNIVAPPTTIVAPATTCPDLGAVTRPFSAYGDSREYQLTPGGAFDTASHGWAATGAAKIVPGGRLGSALALPEGSSVTSPAFCVGIEHPVMRTWVRRTSAHPMSDLKVELLWKTSDGARKTSFAGTELRATSAWSPSSDFRAVDAVPMPHGQRTLVQVRLTAKRGSFAIDDFYLDPARAR